MEKITCTAPSCTKCLRPEELWLPEVKALARANGGKRVAVEDFPKYALCGYHGHLLRKSGVRVYRYLPSVQYAEKADEQRMAKDLKWQPFAEQFAPKADGSEKRKPRKGRKPRRFDGPGQGLSRCAKLDAGKRKAEPKEGSSSAS